MNIKLWILASRPVTLGASLAPVLIAGGLAYSRMLFNFWPFLVALICALFIQVGTNFANDYYDFLTGADKNRTGFVRMIQSGSIAPHQMKIAFIFMFALAILLGVYLIIIGGWLIAVIGILAICFGVLYTGGPYPLAYIGFAEFFVIIFFGPIATWGTYYVQTLQSSNIAIIAGLAPGFLSCALLAVNNLRDINQDKLVGKKTLAVRFGEIFARSECIIFILAAAMVPIFLFKCNPNKPFLLGGCVIIIFAVPSIKLICYSRDRQKLNKTLISTGRMLFLLGTLITLGFLI